MLEETETNPNIMPSGYDLTEDLKFIPDTPYALDGLRLMRKLFEQGDEESSQELGHLLDKIGLHYGEIK